MARNMEMMGVLALFISVIISGCATFNDEEGESAHVRKNDSVQLSTTEQKIPFEHLKLITPKAYTAEEKSEIAVHELMDTKVNTTRNEMVNSIGMKLVWIPVGEFDMGSAEGDPDEKPVHRVQISKGFWMGQKEVTQQQYKAIMSDEPWSGEKFVQESDLNPATYISWEEADEFCRKLSQVEGKNYRLPTEAEWEYACRAGSRTRFNFGDNDQYLAYYGWFEGNAWSIEEKHVHLVGQKYPNTFGLYDMHGNAWEWCSDWYDEDYYSSSPEIDPPGSSSGRFRVIRGGAWHFSAWRCRSADRSKHLPDIKFMSFGFRVVLQDY